MSKKPEGMSFYEWEQIQAKDALSQILAFDRPSLRDNSYTILFLAEYALGRVTSLRKEREMLSREDWEAVGLARGWLKPKEASS